MAATITPYRSAQQSGHDGFAQLLRAEWTKFRTMRGWIIAMLAAAAATALAPIALAGIAKSNDPEGIAWIRGFLRSLAAEGRAVLVSSHLMSELQDNADHLVVIGRGRLVADTSVAELLAAASRDRVTVRTTDRAQAMAVLTGEGATVAITGTDIVTISGLPAQRIAELLGRHDVPFSELAAHRASLEEAYMELTRDSVEFRAPVPVEESA